MASSNVVRESNVNEWRWPLIRSSTDVAGGSVASSSTGPAAKAARGSAVNSSAVGPGLITVRRVTSNTGCFFGAALESCSSITAPCLLGQQETQAYGLQLSCSLGRHRGL